MNESKPAQPGPDYYRSKHAVKYEPPNHNGWMCIPVLEFMVGRPWDQLALDMVRAVRPSCIRVTEGEQTLDARTWRVTVLLRRGTNVIRHIEQEVEVSNHTGQEMYDLLEAAPREVWRRPW